MAKLHYSPNLGKLARCTSDRCPYEHFDESTMKRMAPLQIFGGAVLLKNSYLGIKVRPEQIAPALNQLKSAMSPKLFEQIVQKKAERDGEGSYHITILTPQEYRRLRAEGTYKAPEKDFRIGLEGVGTVSNDSSQAWFMVANSVAVDHYRYSLGLPKHDLHVTLGFTVKDVHGIKKDMETLL